jgi:predicted ATP-dependent endonuclease of OLD family
MIIESVQAKGFRSILDETLVCDSLTALVGANGTGKSSFLKTIDLFYNSSPRVEVEDFYNGDTSSEIVISITFKDLSQDAKDLFAIYLQGDKLTVERVFQWDGSKTGWKYHGATLQCLDFQPIREGLQIKDRGKTAKAAYESVKANPQYSALPAWTTLSNVENDLKQWESANPSLCVRQRDDGQFFGFKEVAQGYLGRFTRFLFIPAVRDASDDTSEGRGSVLTSLMDLVVRSVIANKEELLKLKEDTQKKYQEILDPSQLAELTTLQDQLTNTLKTFVPDAGVQLNWLPLSDINIPLPQADVKLIEDGYSSAVSRTGHGLQRAFILTMLQHLVFAQSTSLAAQSSSSQTGATPPSSPLPNLVLAIEEPELYQHPNRQRHLASILQQLATGKTPGVADKTQIIYSTHSPLFVGIDRIEQIRLLRKHSNGTDKPKITRIISTTLQAVADKIWSADGEPAEHYTAETLLPRLKTIMTPWMSEGFFADVAVLVEGEDDRAAILGVASAKGLDLESRGFSIIPCGGKTSLDRPASIFRQLGISVYLIWDSDKEANNADPKDNHRLLRLLNHAVVDWPSVVHDRFACFEKNLETTLETEIGSELFAQLLSDCQKKFAIPKKKHAVKNPVVISTVLTEAQKQGKTSASLNSIIEKITALLGQQ